MIWGGDLTTSGSEALVKKVRDPSFQVTTVYEFQIGQFSLASIRLPCTSSYTPSYVYVNSDVRDTLPCMRKCLGSFILTPLPLTPLPSIFLWYTISHALITSTIFEGTVPCQLFILTLIRLG